ncbi:hypothetical protein [Aporhodopirellula aestuarii]|uniref:Uncharacterized protein n=1 Tax=Aporhodopirellula aestuarii TaxID=2950107 RepID=A0ABT0UCY1_9BACT|nr:hypothetical protein [Aporhodopirellula aestuarii]MCM2374716.1 hypothetical protein [Aporhodopirellula aestuarii]
MSHEINPYDPPGGSASPRTVVGQTDDEHARRRFGGVLGVASLAAALGFVSWMLLLSSSVSVFVLVVGGLVAVPYLLIWLACRSLRFWFARVMIAIALVGCCLLGGVAFNAVNKDAQGGLNLIFAPIYQLVGTLVLLVLAVVVDRVWHWYSRRSAATQNDG